MTVGAVGLVSAAAFAAALWFSGLVGKARGAVSDARAAMAVMGDAGLDDDAKEARIQAAARGMFASFGAIVLRCAVVLAAPAAAIYGADLAGLADADAVIDFLLSWEALIGLTLAFGAAAWLLGRR